MAAATVSEYSPPASAQSPVALDSHAPASLSMSLQAVIKAVSPAAFAGSAKAFQNYSEASTKRAKASR